MPPKLDELPDGYEVALIAPDGRILDRLDVGGYNLRHEHTVLDLGDNLMRAAEIEATR